MRTDRELSYEEVKKMVHAAVHREATQRDEWFERFKRLLTDDEIFLRDILDGASEEEIERYFAEFPEYEKYRDKI